MTRVVLVCGGRDYEDRRVVFNALDAEHRAQPIGLLVAGGARGADALAEQWARFRNIPVRAFLADWQQHGKAAGPIRNQQMLDEAHPEVVFAFPGGRGTADMMERAKHAGVPVKLLPVTETVSDANQMGFKF